MKIVFASSNAGKIRELQALLPFNIIPQKDLHVTDVAETGLTFVENAILKARHACQTTGLSAIADDSGLEVPSLNGAPGIYSARYAGDEANSQDNIKKLLADMAHIPDENRVAAFHCVLIFLRHAKDPTPLICQGIWHGTILKIPSGDQGFGYDPVFYDPVQQCSAAQLSLEIKNKISHRGQALQLLIKKLLEDNGENHARTQRY